MVDKNMTRYEKIAKDIEKYIDTLSCGDKVGSIRWLMQRFNVAQATLDRSLSVLEIKGRIERFPGRGIFVSNDNYVNSGICKIDLCFFFTPEKLIDNPFFNKIISHLFVEAHRSNCHMNVHVFEQLGDVASFRKRIEHNSPDAVILLCPGKPSFKQALDSINIPSISVFPNAFSDDDLIMLTNNKLAMQIIISHLANLGHERIALLHGQGYDNLYLLGQEERIDYFYSEMSNNGIIVPGRYVLFGGFEPKQGYDATKKLLELRKPPTAIICNDYNAKGVYRAIKENGMSIPEDISVMGFDNVLPEDECSPRLTSISFGFPIIAKKIIDIVTRLSSGENILNDIIYTPIKFIERKSTACVSVKQKQQKKETVKC